jgi:hypothetical protein
MGQTDIYPSRFSLSSQLALPVRFVWYRKLPKFTASQGERETVRKEDVVWEITRQQYLRWSRIPISRGGSKQEHISNFIKKKNWTFLKIEGKQNYILCVCFLLTFHSQLPARTIGEMGNKESVEFITTGGSGPGPGTAAGDPTKPVMRTSLSMEPTSGLCCVDLTAV